MKVIQHAVIRKFTLQLNTVSDAAVIEYLDQQKNKNNAMRQALIKQMTVKALLERGANE